MGLKILPSVAVEENSGMHTHLDQKLKKCSDVDNPSASELCLLGHNLGAVGSRTTSGAYEQKETGTKYTVFQTHVSFILLSGTVRLATVMTNFTHCKIDMFVFVLLV